MKTLNNEVRDADETTIYLDDRLVLGVLPTTVTVDKKREAQEKEKSSYPVTNLSLQVEEFSPYQFIALTLTGWVHPPTSPTPLKFGVLWYADPDANPAETEIIIRPAWLNKERPYMDVYRTFDGDEEEPALTVRFTAEQIDAIEEFLSRFGTLVEEKQGV